MRILLPITLAMMLLTAGCVRIHAYQEHATAKCEESHTAEQCKPATECVHDVYGDCTARTK